MESGTSRRTRGLQIPAGPTSGTRVPSKTKPSASNPRARTSPCRAVAPRQPLEGCRPDPGVVLQVEHACPRVAGMRRSDVVLRNVAIACPGPEHPPLAVSDRARRGRSHPLGWPDKWFSCRELYGIDALSTWSRISGKAIRRGRVEWCRAGPRTRTDRKVRRISRRIERVTGTSRNPPRTRAIYLPDRRLSAIGRRRKEPQRTAPDRIRSGSVRAQSSFLPTKRPYL